MDEQSIINEIKHYVEILLFIERKSGTAIPDDKLIPENFRTLRTLAATVHGLMA